MKNIILNPIGMNSSILQKNDPILRKNAEPVKDFTKLKSIISRMAEALFKEPDGIGIAAPQIGAGLKIFLVAQDIPKHKYLVFINPELKKRSQKKHKDVEGCLSIRGYYGEVVRSEKIIIEYLDEYGKKHSRGASGLLARVVQHEIDHLNGILFIDKAKKIQKIELPQK